MILQVRVGSFLDQLARHLYVPRQSCPVERGHLVSIGNVYIDTLVGKEDLENFWWGLVENYHDDGREGERERGRGGEPSWERQTALRRGEAREGRSSWLGSAP